MDGKCSCGGCGRCRKRARNTAYYYRHRDRINAQRRMLVANDELRAAFLRSHLSGSEVARAAGWLDKRGRPETGRVRRALGLRPALTTHTRWKWNEAGTDLVKHRVQYRNTQTHMSAGNAAILCRALGLDPVDVGL